MTIAEYYRSYVGVLGAISGFVTAIPGLSYLLPSDYAGYIFPPVGPFEPMARALTVLAAIFATFIALYLPRKRLGIAMTICGLLFVTAGLLYFWSFSRYVRIIQIPSLKQSIMVSIGSQRTQFAIEAFPDQTDWEILKERGFEEEEIEKLWTTNSILLARVLLWASLTGVIIFPVTALGIGIASEAQTKAP